MLNRSDFPLLQREIDGKSIVYLDNAATSLKPISVINSISDYYINLSSNIHRGKHRLSEESSDLYEKSRNHISKFVNCASNEVVFLRNTTEAINVSAELLELSPSDRVVTFLDAHHSLYLPFVNKAQLTFVNQLDYFWPDFDHYRELVSSDRTKVVLLTDISNVTGNHYPISELVSIAKENGCKVVLDCAQSVLHHEINFKELEVDFLAFSSHKALGPTGVGVLIINKNFTRYSEKLNIGGGTVDYYEIGKPLQMRKSPHCFEYGTPSIEGAIGASEALKYIESVGFKEIEQQNKKLTSAFVDSLSRTKFLKCVGRLEEEHRSPIFSLYSEHIPDLSDVCRTLSDSFGVMARNGHLCSQPLVNKYSPGQVVRLSAAFYNTVDEITYGIEVLDSIINKYVNG